MVASAQLKERKTNMRTAMIAAIVLALGAPIAAHADANAQTCFANGPVLKVAMTVAINQEAHGDGNSEAGQQIQDRWEKATTFLLDQGASGKVGFDCAEAIQKAISYIRGEQ
jgi:polygalacturonase